MRYFFISLLFFLLIPLATHAAVRINEVAWMGTSVSASDEWIELYNDGTEPVSLAGWTLSAEDGTPSISLLGAIEAGGFYLLERTDDTTVPDISADVIYTGDLTNGGETLVLSDDAGIAVDTVIGGSGWEAIGGNNTTKDTPQRLASPDPQQGEQSDDTWITGTPTPRAVNTDVASAPPSDDTGPSPTPTLAKKITTGGYKQIVFAYAGEDITTVAGADVSFEGYAVSDKNIPISHAMYQWSFGDGAQAKGKEETHTYEEPGTYTVVLRVWSDYQRWRDTLIVTVVSARAHIVGRKVGERGYVEVRNDADMELDLSGWKLAVLYARKHSRDKVFVMPEATVIAPLSSVKFPARITGLSFADEDTVVLQYPSSARVPEPTNDAPGSAMSP